MTGKAIQAEIERLLELCEKATPGPWEADLSGKRHAEDAQAVARDANDHALFDTFNRDYRVSGIMQDLNDEDGYWYDKAGGKDITAVVALRNSAPALLRLLAEMLEPDEDDLNKQKEGAK